MIPKEQSVSPQQKSVVKVLMGYQKKLIEMHHLVTI